MKKSVVAVLVFCLIPSVLITLFAGALALADGIAVTRAYPEMKSSGFGVADPNGTVWDLTRGDLTLSYTLDMSGYVPATTNQEWTEVGVCGPLAQPAGWITAGSPNGIQQNPNAFDYNDKLVLNNNRPGLLKDEYAFDSVYPGNAFGDVSVAMFDLGSMYSNLWFDRGTAALEHPGIQESASTGGRYTVSVTYHAVSPTDGTMFATVNGKPNLFIDTRTWRYVQVGKSFNTDVTKLQVYVNIRTPGAKITGFKATGAPASVILDGTVPNSAVQGDRINHMYVNGFQFRDVAAVLELHSKASAQRINASKLTYENSTYAVAEMTIPETATIGLWDTNFWHTDDPAGKATKPDSFRVIAAPPEVTGVSVTHSRPNKSFTMTVTGRHLRNIATTLRLVRGGEIITATNVKWVSSTQVKGDFTIPANAYIGADWTLSLSNEDGVSFWQYFSVDARVDVYSNGFLNMIWLRAPWVDTVVVYSEGSFDATTLFPLGCSFGGTFPFACNVTDWNRDGRKDLLLYLNNMAVNLPTGRSLAQFDGATLGLRRIKGFDSVYVFRFLF